MEKSERFKPFEKHQKKTQNLVFAEVFADTKSAHTALAVKACLLGGNSNTKCSMTFVNIAVAISALAGGGKNGFAPRPAYGGVFDFFRGFLGV